MHAAFALAQDLLNWPSPLSEAKIGRPGRARMRQCITLAVLVHVWLVLVFGTAPGGSALPGEGAWGRLSVRLEGPPNFGNPDVSAPADNGPVGEAQQQRSGGTVRPESSQKLDQPGAAKTGAWKPVDSPNEPLLTDTATPVVTPSSSDLSPATPNAQSAQSTSIPTLPSAALDQLQPMSTSRLSDSNARADAPKIAPLAKATQATRSADLPSMAVPSLDGLKPMSTATLNASGSTSPDLPAKTSEKLSRVAPAPIQRNELNQMNLPSLDGVKPMSTATLDAASANSSNVEALRQEKAAAMSKLEAAKATTSAQDIGAAPKVDVAAPVAGSPAPGQGQRPSAVASGGSPDAGTQKGHDVATAPSASASKPALNLNLPQRGPLVRGGSGSGMLAVVPTPPDTKKNAMEKAVKKAEKADCRNAYAGAGILAPAAAVIDAATGKGCTF
ncbi:hypothetical protein ACFJGW_17200 [Burkholderiaceae bacterium UC74_6]